VNQDEDFFLPVRPREPKPTDVPVTDADYEYVRLNLFRALGSGQMIKKTFDELGIKSFRPLRKTLLLRTERIPDKVGSIFVPPKLATFYGELPHMQPILAFVLAAGPKATVRAGDRILFMRLHFARWQTLEDGTVCGWIDEANILGWADPENADARSDRGSSLSAQAV
jgi:hypothetical protein